MKYLFKICTWVISGLFWHQVTAQEHRDSIPYKLTFDQETIERVDTDGDIRLLSVKNHKLAYVTSSLGQSIICESVFVEHFKANHEIKTCDHYRVHPLTLAERKKSGGYDAIVSIYVKLFAKNQKRRIVKKLGKQKVPACPPYQ